MQRASLKSASLEESQGYLKANKQKQGLQLCLLVSLPFGLPFSHETQLWVACMRLGSSRALF